VYSKKLTSLGKSSFQLPESSIKLRPALPAAGPAERQDIAEKQTDLLISTWMMQRQCFAPTRMRHHKCPNHGGDNCTELLHVASRGQLLCEMREASRKIHMKCIIFSRA
jgi:hypothetical protein